MLRFQGENWHKGGEQGMSLCAGPMKIIPNLKPRGLD